MKEKGKGEEGGIAEGKEEVEEEKRRRRRSQTWLAPK